MNMNHLNMNIYYYQYVNESTEHNNGAYSTKYRERLRLNNKFCSALITWLDVSHPHSTFAQRTS